MPERCEISVGGQDFSNQLEWLQLDQSIEGHHVLRARVLGLDLADPSFSSSDRRERVNLLGESLSLTIESDEVSGVPGTVTKQFTGIVTEVDFDHHVDARNTFWVVAHSPTIAMDGVKRNRLFHEQTASEIIESVLRDHNITIGTIDSTSDTLAYCVQYQETDYEFVVRLASGSGKFAYYDGQRFQVSTASSATSDPELRWMENLRGFRVGLGTRSDKFQAQAWDYVNKQVISGEISGALRTSLSSPLGKPHEVSEELYGESGFIPGLKAGSQGDLDKTLEVVRSGAVAQLYNCSGSSWHPEITSGKCVNVQGIGDTFSGSYFVKSVRFTWGSEVQSSFTSSGGDDDEEETIQLDTRFWSLEPWQQELDRLEGPRGRRVDHNVFVCVPLSLAYPQATGRKQRFSDVQSALVTSTDDPDGLGRVKVKFHWHSGTTPAEPEKWVRVLTPHAGGERGLFCLPEIDDEVLVAFEHGDPERPVILGSLYNGVDAAPVGHSAGFTAADNDLKLFRTKRGNEIYFVDKDGSEILAIMQGDGTNKMLLDLSGPSITVESEGDITIKGATVTLESTDGDIKIDSAGKLQVDSSTDTEIKAGGNLKTEGSMNAEVKGGVEVKVSATTVGVNGSAMTEIKGGIVKIN